MKMLKPIGIIVGVIIVIGFVRWAILSNNARNPQGASSLKHS